MPRSETLLLIDASSQIYRAYHALPELSNSAGTPTNAVYGFTTMLRKSLAQEAPDYVAAVFDPPGPTIRHAAYEDYKSSRPEMPADLAVQFPYIKRVCEALRVPVLEVPRYEADDVIGTLAALANAAGLDTIIISEDKDLLQLVGPRVRMLVERAGRQLYTPEKVEDKYGVTPDRIPDLLGLMGDTVDDIPGVPGIGPKRARELLTRYGSVEGAIEHAEELSKYKYARNLIEFADQARLSKQLATIQTDVEVACDLQRLQVQEPDRVACRELFGELEFNRIMAEFVEPPSGSDGDYRTLAGVAELESALEEIRRAGRASVVVAADHPEPCRAKVIGLALSWDPGSGCYLPIAHEALGAENAMPLEEALAALQTVLDDPTVDIVGQDVKFDLVILARHGLSAIPVAFDSMVASYLLHPGRQSHDLETLALEFLETKTTKLADILPDRKATLALAPVAEATRYAAEEADLALRLASTLEAELEAQELTTLFREIEIPLISVLADMECRGVRIDADHLAEMSTRLADDLDKLRVSIYAAAGGEFNINSPKQLAEVLFDRLELPSSGRTAKTGSRSTRAEVLEALSAEHPIAARIIEYRELTKLKSTYIDTLPELVNPATGRVHTTFNQAVAATGRLSSSNPNLQNIPIRTPLGREIRRAFVPADGCVLLTADYSQIELRILAHLSADPTLRRAFSEGVDIHLATAAEIFSTPASEVTAEQRRRAKVINFGVLYGMGPRRLGREFGISTKEARAFIDRYFESYGSVKEHLEQTVERAKSCGFVTTLLGRKRHLPELQSGRHMVRAFGERVAVNTPIQGTAADLIKLAMVNLYRRLQEEGFGAAMIIQVHDELVLEVPQAELGPVAELARSEMEGALRLDVPLEVDIGTGPNWMDAKA